MKLAEMEKAIRTGERVGWSGVVTDAEGVERHRFELYLGQDSNQCTVDGRDEPELAKTCVNLIRFAQGDADGHLIGAFFEGYLHGRNEHLG